MGLTLKLGLLLILAQASSSSDLNRRFDKALELQRKGDLRGAEAAYREVLKVAPRYGEAHANLGAVLIRLNHYEEAIREYETALQLSPQLKPVLLNIGIAHFRRSAYAQAVDALKRFLDTSPGHVQATQLMALALVELGRDESALKYLEPALSSAPNDPALIYALGLASLRLRKPMVTGAIQALAEVPGGLPASRLLQGQANLTNFQFEKAIGDLEEARRLDPKLPRLCYSLGLAYFKSDRYGEARAAFEAELKRTPKDVSSLCYLASIDEKEGKLDSARKRLAAALSLEPGSADANGLLGRILLAQGKAAEAVKPLELAVAGDPADAQARYQLARAYQQLGRTKEAERELSEMKRLRAEEFDGDRAKVVKP